MKAIPKVLFLCQALLCLALFAGNDKQQANGYDNAWEDGWVQHCRTIYNAGTGKTAGFVLQIGDSITHANPYSQWPRYGAGKTSEDSALCTWASTSVMGSGTNDVNNKNGFYLAVADTASRGMTAAGGISTAEMLSGSGNGSTAMPSDTNTASAKLKIADATYNNDIHIDTLAAAFADARYAVLMLGTNDANAGRSANAFITDLTAIVDKLEARKIVVILSTIPPMTSAGGASVDAYNTAIRNLCQTRGLPLIDYHAEILARRPGTGWQNTLISSDGVHPSATGGGYDAASNPYADGGDAATHTTGAACANSGYLLRSWLAIQKLKEVKSYVGDGVNPPSGGPVIASIAVTPVNPSVTAGATQQFSAVAKDPNGNAVTPQPSFTWSVSGGGTINGSGLLTAAAAAGGPYTVTASASSKSGSTNFSVVAAAATVNTITVSPSPVSVQAGGTATFSAEARDAGGNLLSPQPAFTWSVSAGGSIDAAGVLTAATSAGGPFTVSAAAGGKTGSGSFTITARSTVDSITLSPASASIAAGETKQFSAALKDQYGNLIAGVSVTWTVTSGGGSISSSGLFTASASAGDSIITASAGGKSASATVSVSARNHGPLIPSLPTATPDPATVGVAVHFFVAATDADNDPLVYTWDFGDGSTGSGQSPTHTFAAAGTYFVFATATDSHGASVNNVIVLNVNAAGSGDGGNGGGGGSTASEIDPVTGEARLPLTVTALSGSFRFGGSRDGCSVSGVIPGMPAGFNPAGSASVHVGAASVSFTLDAKGKGKSAQGMLQLSLKPSTKDPVTRKPVFAGGDLAFKIKLAKGAWASAWQIDPAATIVNGTLPLDVGIKLGSTSYGSAATATYSSTAGKGGKFKK